MKFDLYPIKARFKPAMLVVLPISLSLAAWFPDRFAGWAVLAGVVVAGGLGCLLAELGRDQGKLKQGKLFQQWGGKPTTRKLRHRDTPFDWVTLSRRHAKLGTLVGLPAPSREEEVQDPGSADQLYEAYTRYLLEATRDHDRFPLVFAENISYGYRRNLWGWKPLGIILAIIGIVASGVPIIRDLDAGIEALPVLSTGLNLLLFLLWCFWIRPRWVRLAADAYADRLIAACEKLANSQEQQAG
jgi:hypothetical protein